MQNLTLAMELNRLDVNAHHIKALFNNFHQGPTDFSKTNY
jgi:hypothetical protein